MATPLGLALQYNSSGGPNVAGLGWGLSGISRIHRCSKIPASDGYSAKVTWDDQEDNFCLDGQKLVEVDLDRVPEGIPARGTSGMEATNEYRLERDDLTRIIRFESGSQNAWIRILHDGTADYYGDTPLSRGDYVETGGYHRFFWYRSASIDVRHNLIEYDYQKDTGDEEGAVRLPEEIRWGRAVDGTYVGAAENRVTFHYQEENENGGTTRWVNGARMTSSMMLKGIRIYAPSNWSTVPTLVRQYVLEHALSPRSLRWLLSSAKVCGPDVQQCIPATTFEYGGPSGSAPIDFVVSEHPNTILAAPAPDAAASR